MKTKTITITVSSNLKEFDKKLKRLQKAIDDINDFNGVKIKFTTKKNSKVEETEKKATL